ncbi:WhiB family transcriptional regulator [Streptomyces acidicola]|uniref:WhiB family transcriptional regulator n=1 Tax=Streptomyces acidicola TaxID=2596892 RepID=UPI0037A84F8B
MSAPNTLPNTLSWAEQAACRGRSLGEFFTDSQRGIVSAKRICRICPVREECLTEALRAEDGSRYGVYGGLTPAERAELVATPQPTADRKVEVPPPPKTGRKPAECGTRSAYQRHVRKKEPIDAACRAANTAADRRLRNTGSTKARA